MLDNWLVELLICPVMFEFSHVCFLAMVCSMQHDIMYFFETQHVQQCRVHWCLQQRAAGKSAEGVQEWLAC